MKKLFFHKSSSSHGGEHDQKSPATREKKQYPQTRWKTVGSGNAVNKFQSTENFFPVCERKVTEKKTISRTRSFVLRRSQSYQVSAAADDSGRFSEQDRAVFREWKNVQSSHSQCDCPDCDYEFTNRDSRPERVNLATIQLPNVEALRDRSCSCPSNSSSPRSSFDSTSVSGKVLDLYVDGEHHQEMKLGINGCYPRGSNERNLIFPCNGASRDHSLKSENQLGSPRKLAKDVVERLLRIENYYDSKKPGDNHLNVASMTSTVCDKHLDEQSHAPEADISAKASPFEDVLDKHLDGRSSTLLPEDEDPTDLTLRRKSEEVKERARILSGQLVKKRFLQYYSGDLPALCQTVRDLMEEERNLLLEICELLQSRITERNSAREAESLFKGEMNSALVKLEEEKDEVQSRLQKELDRRSDEWELKLRELQSEEHRLRDRVRELAEQNVCLQREISSSYDREKEYADKLSDMEVHLNDLRDKMEITKSENDSLHRKLSDIQDKLKVADEVQSSMERKYKEKEREYLDLIKEVARLRGTCNEQERTIDGIRHCSNSENLTNKLQTEQLRLIGVEQDLRRQLDTCSAETKSLRSENIYLLERLKSIGEVGGSSALKLEQELESYTKCLQNTGLSLLNECIRMSENLLGIVERKTTPEGFLETHSLVQCGMKIQGFRKGLDQLTRRLGKTTSIIKEKADFKSDSSASANRKVLEDDLKSELKAERLLTSILKEKLYSKEKEVELMQVEVARALRSDDVLKKEIQDAADTVSCVNHKMKNLELQMIKKDGTLNELQGEIRSYDEELTKTRGILSKVTQERDLMWQEVKQYSEKNMLLNREVDSFKKKIETLEEDTLFKDGQISILKDSLNNANSFNILFDSEQPNGF